MLQKFMDMNGFLYSLAGIGILGIAVLFIINTVSRKNIQDKTSYEGVIHKLKLSALISSILLMAVTSAAMGVTYSMGQIRTLGMRYLLIGIGIVFLFICYGKFLAFSDRERVLGDYLFRLIDQQQQQTLTAATVVPPTKEQLVEKAVNGIKASASNGDNKFSHILSREEEDVMREVISEFIT